MEHVAAAARQRDTPVVLDADVLVVGDTLDLVEGVVQADVALRELDLVGEVADVEELFADVLHVFGFGGLILRCGSERKARHQEKDGEFFHAFVFFD